jgi:hypothetical protein
MNQNPSSDSSPVPTSSQSTIERTVTDDDRQAVDEVPGEQNRVNPKLQEALVCLDVKLEDELNKFRSKQTNRLADTPPPIMSAVTGEQRSVEDRPDFDEKVVTGEIIGSGILDDITDRHTLNVDRSGEFMATDASPNPQLAEITTVDDTPLSIYAETENFTADENLDLNFAPRGEISPFQVGYLASSQELLDRGQLKSDENDVFEDPADSYVTSSKPQFFTFRKLSLLAIAWIVAGGAAYAYFNPNMLDTLTAKLNIPTIATTGSLGQSIQGPNLAANEFTEINLSTINTIKVPTTVTATQTSTVAATTNPNPIQVTPFKGTNFPGVSPAAITAQPQLADSLVKSLLPPNFHAFAKRVRTDRSMTGR